MMYERERERERERDRYGPHAPDVSAPPDGRPRGQHFHKDFYNKY